MIGDTQRVHHITVETDWSDTVADKEDLDCLKQPKAGKEV